MFAGRQPNRCTRFVFCGPDKRFHVCAVRFFQMQNALNEAFSTHEIPLRNQTKVAMFLPARPFGNALKLTAKPGKNKKRQPAKTHQDGETYEKKGEYRSNQCPGAQHGSGFIAEYENHLFQPVAVPQMEKNLLVCLLHSNRHKQPPLLINAAILRRIPFLRRDYTYFSTQHKNRLPAFVESGYISAAPHKTGAGILNPLTTHAHNRASGFFVRTVLPRLIRVRIMAGRTGPTSVGPGSCVPGQTLSRSTLISTREMWLSESDLVSREQDIRLNLEFDFKRQPVHHE